jgi:glutamine amidotransferase
VKLAIVDLAYGNIGSIRFALERLGVSADVTSDPQQLALAERVILPGVGAACQAMERIDRLQLRETLRSLRQPALGICLGMQLLFESSDEGDVTCLGLIEGRVREMEPGPGRPVPHMGWSKVDVLATDLGVSSGDYLYFAHRYACDPGPATIATVSYGSDLPVIVRKENWLGAQFHPERSGEAGARFLKSFLE